MNKELGPVELARHVVNFHTTFLPPDESITGHEINEEMDKCMEAEAILEREYRQGIISADEYFASRDFLNAYTLMLHRTGFEKISNL